MSVGDINVKLGLDTTAFSTALASAKMQALALGGSFDGIGKALNNLGATGGGALAGIGKSLGTIATLANPVTVGIAAIGAAAVVAGAQMAKMAADYQSAMAKVGATTGQSNKQLKDMQDLMYKNTATGSRLNMTQQANIAAGLGGAGLIGATTSPEEQLAQIRLVERAMVALEAPTEDVIQLFSVLQTRYGSNTEGMSKTASSIATMADETAATNAEVIQATLTLGRLAGKVAMTEPEMVALAAATKSYGIEAAEVGTVWGSLVNSLMSTSQETDTAFEKLGLTQEDWFAALRDSKNTGSSAPVLKFLKELDTRIQKSSDSAEISQRLFGTYGARIAGGLGQITAKYDQLSQSSKRAYEENVRLDAEYERMTNTMNSMLDAIGAKFNAIGVRIGTVLLTPIQDATYQFDQFLGKVMQGDFAGAWRGMYDAVLNYNWVGAGMQIASMVASGLSGLASFAANALGQLAVSILTHDWIGTGRSIAEQILSGLSSIGSMARGVLGDISSWVNSGGATSAGRSLANWIIDGAQAVFGAGVDLLGWLRTNLTMDKVAGIVKTAFNMGSELINLGIQAGKDFVSGVSSAITEKFGGVWTSITTSAGNLYGDFKELGARMANALTAGVAESVNNAFNPIIAKINEVLRGLDTYSSKLGVPMPQFEPLALSGTSYGSGSTDWQGQASKIMSGGWVDTKAMYGNVSGARALQYKNQYDLKGYITEQAASGMSLSEIMQSARTLGIESQYGTMTTAEQLQAWNAGQAQRYNGKTYGPVRPEGATSGTSTPSEAATADAMKTMANTWSGGVVPVEVTNWPGGYGAGGVAGEAGTPYGPNLPAGVAASLKTFDQTKLAQVTSAGMGPVGTMSATTSYADRLNIDTCEIDNFGMTPGLGAELAATGVWKPIYGNQKTEALKNEIGYTGEYASNYGAILGNLNQAMKTQTTTANKTAGIQVGAATKSTGIIIGGMTQASHSFQAGTGVAAKTMEASALNAKIIQEDGAYSCFNIWGEGSERVKEDWESCGTIINQAGASAGSAISASGTHVADSTVKMSESLKGGASDIKAATTELKSGVSSAMGSLVAQGSAFLSTTFGGLFTGIGMGGGSTSTAGLPSSGAWGGTSISGGGAWVGTGATGGTTGWGQTSWGGTAASNAARSGGSGSWGSVKWFADGGIITKPSIVGVGEAGTEAIVPIAQLPGMIAQAIGGSGGAGGHTHAIYMDGKKVADAVGAAMITRTRQGAGLKVR